MYRAYGLLIAGGSLPQGLVWSSKEAAVPVRSWRDRLLPDSSSARIVKKGLGGAGSKFQGFGGWV